MHFDSPLGTRATSFTYEISIARAERHPGEMLSTDFVVESSAYETFSCIKHVLCQLVYILAGQLLRIWRVHPGNVAV